MRRYSFFLFFAALVLALLVAYTYIHRSAREHPPNPVTRIERDVQAIAKTWHWGKDDPQTNCPVVRVVSSSFRAVHDPSTFELTDMQLKLFNKGCSSYTYVQSSKAEFDEASEVMTSKNDVLIIMKVPADKEPDDKKATANLVHIRTTGVRYETKSGKAETSQPAAFQFANGRGHSVGADYDPNTHQLHMKSQVSLDWFGNGPPEDSMHIEAGELRYEEDHGKVYLSPWSSLKRRNTVLRAANSEVTLDQGVLKEVDSLNAKGVDQEENRHVDYGGDKLVALFNDNGDMTQITAEPKAYLTSTDKTAKTGITANQAVLTFDIKTDVVNGEERNSSVLHQVFAKGNAAIDSSPVLQPGIKPADTRVLRSEAIRIAMKEGGEEIQSLETDAPGQLEFKPNQPDRAHRWLNGDRIQVSYGDENSIDSFHASKASTRTEKPLPPGKQKGKDGKPLPPPAPSLTWSDELLAKFSPHTNDLATLEQTGNFRYEEGVRRATAVSAYLEQASNKITLKDQARLWDDTGVTSADIILLNQQNGDMDATGKVASTRQPDKPKDNQKSSLLDETESLQARADKMQSRENNLQIRYEGHAILWQGVDRIQADVIDIDRDNETLHARGHVVSQLIDKQKKDESTQTTSTDGQVHLQPVVNKTEPALAANKPMIFTIVRAPDLFYKDDERIAHYTGGVTLVHDQMVVTSKELRAFLTNDNAGPDKQNNQDSGTSLDHAFADGDVKVVESMPNRTRTGTSQHCEYYPDENKVILNGGIAKMADTRKGTTMGQQLTYYPDYDRIVVEGMPKKPAISDMNKSK
jgi:lipopolysaccharide export system protein LptA